MSHPSKGGLLDSEIRYPPVSSERLRPRAVWGPDPSVGSGGMDRRPSGGAQSSHGNSSVLGEAVEAQSVGANGMYLGGQGQYPGPGNEKLMLPLLAKKFEEAVEQNEELRSEIDRLTQCCNTYIGEADKAVKDMKSRHRAQLREKVKEATERANEMEKLYQDTLKQYEDAKIVVLSYKSKNIELEGHIRGLTAQLEEAQKAVQRGASGSPREVERLRRDLAELKRDHEACVLGLKLKDEDLREICDKRDVWKTSFQQAADERDLLQIEVAQLKRRLAEQDSSSSKKEATTLRKQLQDSQIHIAELQDQVKDLQQQLASASTGSMLQAQETQGLTDAMQKQHEQELLEQRTQASQWKAQFQEVEKEVTQWKTRCQELQEQVQFTQGEVDALKYSKSELLTSVNGLKRELDAKEEQIRGLLAERSALEQQRAAPARPSDGEGDHLARPTEKRHVEELTKELKVANDTIKHLELHIRQMGPTSPTTQMPNAAQTKRMNQLMDQVEELRKTGRELEQECDHLRQSEVEMSRELSSSRGRAKELTWHLDTKEGEMKDLREQLQTMGIDMDTLRRALSVEHEAIQRLQHTHQQEKQQLESRAEQADVRFKDYRRELKEHAQALQRVGKELQAERTNRERLKAELEQCRLELASVKKELQDEKGTGNLLRDQLKQYVSDFQMEKQGHQRTAQDKRALEQRLRDLERDFRKLQQDYDSRQSPKRLSYLYKVDSQEEPPRVGRPDQQYTEYARATPPMYQTPNTKSGTEQVPKAGGIQPPGGGVRMGPHDAPSQAYIHPLAPGGGVQNPRGAAGEDTAARRHPCPICGRTFPDLQKLERHASNCNGQ